MDNAILEMYKTIVGIGDQFGLMGIIKTNPDKHFPLVWNAMMNVYMKVAIPVAVGLMVIYFLIRITESQLEAGTDMNLQTMMKPLMGLALGITVLFIGSTSGSSQKPVVISAFELGQGITNSLIEVIDVGADNDERKTAEKNVILINNSVGKADWVRVEEGTNDIVVDNKFGMIEAFGKLIKPLMPYILATIGSLYGLVIVYGRLFELYIRIAVAPIALADMFVKGADSTGFRFLREVVALSIQGAIIALILYAFSMVQSQGLLGGSGISATVAMTIAQVALLGQSRSISKSLVGIN